jgi:hypothetical protein
MTPEKPLVLPPTDLVADGLLSSDEAQTLRDAADITDAVTLKAALRSRVWTLLQQRHGFCGTRNGEIYAAADRGLDALFQEAQKHRIDTTVQEGEAA